MSVHALFRMARCLYPIAPQTVETFSPAPPSPPSPPPGPAQNPPPIQTPVFRPSHALYSSITGRHAQLQRARAACQPPQSAPAAQPASKAPDTAPKTPDSVPLEAT